jgi:tetratricopeptide (TPR) repeat protein
VQDCLAELDLLRVRSLLATHEGRWEEAESMVQELLRRCRKVPFPWMEAKALQALGQLHAAQNEPTQALKAYQQALTICTRLGEWGSGSMRSR